MTRITDEQMQAALMQTRDYTVVLLEEGGVRAGVFTYPIHPSRSFPGDTLPA